MWMLNTVTGLAQAIWHTFNDAAIYIIFGIFVAGIINMLVDGDKIVKHLGKPDFKSVFFAALFGVPLPLCSCGVIPTAMSLRKSGASKGATLSFLISTPETGLDSIFLSYALLDPLMTIFRPVAAFITALAAGISENIFGKKDKSEEAKHAPACAFCNDSGHDHNHTLAHKFTHSMRYAFITLLGDIAKWLTLGIVIGGVISYFIPESIIGNYLGYGWQPMLLMLAIGIPLYICASASTPIAAALIAKGMSPGVALVFLLAGPATNIAGILAVGKFLGKRSVVVYLASIAVCALILGFTLNWIYTVFNIDIHTMLGKASDIFPPYVRLIASVILIILMVVAIRFKEKCEI